MATRPEDDDPETDVIRSDYPLGAIEAGVFGGASHPHGDSFLHDPPGDLSGIRAKSVPKCVLEWSGSAWAVVEIIGAADGFETSPAVDEMEKGSFPGQRILTPLRPSRPAAG